MKAQNANLSHRNNKSLKSLLIVVAMLLVSVHGRAQEQTPFPYKSGSEAMAKFFKDSLQVSPDMVAKKATGTVILKFSADAGGKISKIVVYYADDISLVQPVIDVLNKTNHQWNIPIRYRIYDYVVSFTINFNPPATANGDTMDQVYKFYTQRKPVTAANEVPLGPVTMLPNVVVGYDVQ